MKVIRLQARAFARDVICGNISLKEVPRRLRLRNDRYYIFAMRYYQYDRNILNPLLVWKSDINSLPDGHPDKKWLYDRYMDYKMLNEEQLANKERARCKETDGSGGDLGTTNISTR